MFALRLDAPEFSRIPLPLKLACMYSDDCLSGGCLRFCLAVLIDAVCFVSRVKLPGKDTLVFPPSALQSGCLYWFILAVYFFVNFFLSDVCVSALAGSWMSSERMLSGGSVSVRRGDAGFADFCPNMASLQNEFLGFCGLYWCQLVENPPRTCSGHSERAMFPISF